MYVRHWPAHASSYCSYRVFGRLVWPVSVFIPSISYEYCKSTRAFFIKKKELPTKKQNRRNTASRFSFIFRAIILSRTLWAAALFSKTYIIEVQETNLSTRNYSALHHIRGSPERSCFCFFFARFQRLNRRKRENEKATPVCVQFYCHIKHCGIVFLSQARQHRTEGEKRFVSIYAERRAYLYAQLKVGRQ